MMLFNKIKDTEITYQAIQVERVKQKVNYKGFVDEVYPSNGLYSCVISVGFNKFVLTCLEIRQYESVRRRSFTTTYPFKTFL